MQLQQAMDTDTVFSSADDDADVKKHLSVAGTATNPNSCSLPARPLWMHEDTLMIYTLAGLSASSKVLCYNQHLHTPTMINHSMSSRTVSFTVNVENEN